MTTLGCLSDELGNDVETILSTADLLNLDYVEPRVVVGRNVASAPRDVLERLSAGLQKREMETPCLASPLLKTAIADGPDDPAAYDSFNAEFSIDEQVALADKLGQIAELFDTDYVRIFSGWPRPDLSWPSLLEGTLRQVVNHLYDYDVKPVMEIDHMCNVTLADDFYQLPSDLTADIEILFDTGNYVLGGGNDVMKELRRYGDSVSHVHLKDATAENCVPLGEGRVPAGEVLEYVKDRLGCSVTIESYAADTKLSNEVQTAREYLN